MNKVVIFVNEDWADEFNYPIFSITNKETVENQIKYLEENPFAYGTHELGFGTNEYFEFSSKEIISILKTAQPADKNELKTLTKFLPQYLGLNIISRVEGIINDS